MTLLVLAALFVAADRIAVAVAEDQVGDRIAEQADLPGSPEVDIRGFPFLTQALSGRYDDVGLSFTSDDLGQPTGTRGVVSLRGVEVPLSDVVSGSVRQIPVELLEGSATLSSDLLSAEMGPGTEWARDARGLRITRTVEAVGRSVPWTAAGEVSLDGRDLVIDVREASGVGVDLPDAVVAQVSDQLGLRYTVPDLPFELALTDVRPGEDGVVVTAQGQGTVIGG